MKEKSGIKQFAFGKSYTAECGKLEVIMRKYKRSEFIRGIKAGFPVFIAFLPIATTFSVLAMNAGLSRAETNTMSILLLAGASQMMAVNMIFAGAGIFEIVLATFIINLRHLIMSSYVMNRLKTTPRKVRLLLAFGITDETFAILSAESEKKENEGCFFGGLVLITYGSWVFGTVLGSILIYFIPTFICNSMVIALYAMFIAIIVPDIIKNYVIGVIVLISMILNYVLSLLLPSSWAFIVAMLASAYIGTFLIGKEEKKCEYI